MAIYGTALLAICLLAGLVLGDVLGRVVGIDANVGGVGIAMLLLIVVTGRLQRAGHLRPPSDNGIVFWSSIYIPIVVAMAASQNVRGALSGGAVAIAAGVAAVVVSFALVPVIVRLGPRDARSADATVAIESPAEGRTP
jgi:malonate transporter MadL subunit